MVYHVLCSDEKCYSRIAIAKTDTLKQLNIYETAKYRDSTDVFDFILSGFTVSTKYSIYNSKISSKAVEVDRYIGYIPEFAKKIVGNKKYIHLSYGSRFEKTFTIYLLLSFLKNITTNIDTIIIHSSYCVSSLCCGALCCGAVKPVDPHELEILNFFAQNKNVILLSDLAIPDYLDEQHNYYGHLPESELIPNIDPQKPFGYLCPELYEGTGYTPPDEPLTFRKITDEELMAKLQDSNSNGKPIEESIDEISRFRR